jgi:hypothetical protein
MPQRSSSLWPRVLLAAASLTVLASAPAQYLGRQQDDLLYIIGSQALLQGHYRLFTLVGAPPLTMITPGFPLLLLPVTLLGGENLAAHQVFSALALAALPWAFFLWLKERLDEGVSALVSALAVTSPVMLSQAGTVMSEPFYTLIAVALLLALEKRQELAGWGYLFLTQVRPAGLSAAGALKPRLWLPAAGGALAWSLWSFAVSGEVQELQEIRLSFAGQGWSFPFQVAFDNIVFYLSAWGGSYTPWLPFLAGLGLAALAARGCWKKKGPAAFMLAGAALMHLFWAWQYERYLIPLLPWLLWGAAEALGRRAKPVLFGLLLLQTGLHTWRWALRPSPYSQPELAAAYTWLRANTQQRDALASALPVRDGYWSVRPASPLPDAESAEDFAARLKKRGVRWVLWQAKLDVGLSSARSAAIGRLLERAKTHLDTKKFRLAYQDDESRIYYVR